MNKPGIYFSVTYQSDCAKKSEFSSPTDSLYVVYCRWNYFPAGSQIIHQFNLGMIKLFPVSADVTRWWCWGADGERKEMGCSEAPLWALLLQVGFLFPELGRCLITVCHMESCLLIFVGLSGSFTRDHNTVPLMMPAVFSSVHNSLLLLQPQSSERWSFYKLISPQPSRTGFFYLLRQNTDDSCCTSDTAGIAASSQQRPSLIWTNWPDAFSLFGLFWFCLQPTLVQLLKYGDMSVQTTWSPESSRCWSRGTSLLSFSVLTAWRMILLSFYDLSRLEVDDKKEWNILLFLQNLWQFYILASHQTGTELR